MEESCTLGQSGRESKPLWLVLFKVQQANDSRVRFRYLIQRRELTSLLNNQALKIKGLEFKRS